MALPFLPYSRQCIQEDDLQAVAAALQQPILTQGPLVEQFEEALASFLGVKHAVVVSNGTAALHIASMALGLKPGDAVLVPSVSFVATSNAVLYCGATPIFVDVDATTGHINLPSAAQGLALAKARGLRPKAIYPVHLAGLPCDPAPLAQFAKENGLYIVEDACHALGAHYRLSEQDTFRPVGTYADMGTFSFHPVKHIATGEGGAVTTNDDGLATRLKILRTHGITKNAADFTQPQLAYAPGQSEPNAWYYEMQHLGYNYRLPDILCALGLSQLKKAPQLIADRVQHARSYQHELSDIQGLGLPVLETPYARSSVHLYPVRLPFAGLGKTRHQVMTLLREKGIGSQVHYIPIPWQPYYQKNPNLWLSTPLPQTEIFYEATLSIPLYPQLTPSDRTRVVEALRLLF